MPTVDTALLLLLLFVALWPLHITTCHSQHPVKN